MFKSSFFIKWNSKTICFHKKKLIETIKSFRFSYPQRIPNNFHSIFIFLFMFTIPSIYSIISVSFRVSPRFSFIMTWEIHLRLASLDSKQRKIEKQSKEIWRKKNFNASRDLNSVFLSPLKCPFLSRKIFQFFKNRISSQFLISIKELRNHIY